jgi:hypothetical protein
MEGQPMKLLNPEHVADILGVPVKVIHELCRDKMIEHIQVTSKRRAFTPEQVRKFIERRTIRTADSSAGKEYLDPGSGDFEPINYTPPANPQTIDLISLKKEMKRW